MSKGKSKGVVVWLRNGYDFTVKCGSLNASVPRHFLTVFVIV